MAYRRTEGVEARLADKRTRILEAARQLVAEGGWADTQVASVAAAAGLATGTVYRYFASKAELFAEVLARVSEREVEVMGEIARSAASPREGLHSAVGTFVKRAMRNRRLAYALIAEPCEHEIDAARLTWRHAISQQVLALVKAGQRDGSFRKGLRAEVAATVIVGGFMEALVGPLSPLAPEYGSSVERDPAAVQRLAEQIADLCCACVESLAVASLPTKPPPKRKSP
jgi:AcrR family transcriptional regulator